MTNDTLSEENESEPPTEPPPAPITASDVDFRRMVSAARRKVKNGSTLTNQESAALKKFDKDQEEGARWKYYATIPKKHWERMSGRHRGQIAEQADRYGIPFGGPVIDLPAVVKALHNFFAANAMKLAKDDDPMLAGGDSPMLEKYREEQTKIIRMKRREMEKQLISRDESRMSMGKMASILRNCGEILQKQFGPGALDVLNEAMDDVGLEMERTFGDVQVSSDEDERTETTPT